MNRRTFIKSTIGAAAGLYLSSIPGRVLAQADIPQGVMLGRLCTGSEGSPFEIKAKPDINSNTIGTYYYDDVVPWLREVSASRMNLSQFNQRWVETDKGYIDSANVQPVKNIPNNILTQLPVYGQNPGMWVEITVPYADLVLIQPPSGYWLRTVNKPRVYFSQVFWCDQISQDQNGKILYRLSERVGSLPDYYFAPAEACKPLLPDELTVLSPEVGDKKVVVNLMRQTLTAYENGREVYFCRVSTGAKLADGWATPPGEHYIWRKLVSMHFSASAAKGEGFDTPGVGWTTLFTSDGVAFHAAFWHNEFGKARSHGCVNCLPEDAKWVWRWTLPHVDYDPGDLVIKEMNSTRVIVEAGE
jgi:hypothetical protein